jgi:hypothetical protein
MSSPAEISASHRTAPIVGEIQVLSVTTSSVRYKLAGPHTLSAVSSSGTTPPTVTVSGAPRRASWSFHLDCTTGGTLGTAAFRWSLDGGSTWEATFTTTAGVTSYELGRTGVTATLTAGTYNADNLYTFTPVWAILHRADLDDPGLHEDRWFVLQADGATVYYAFGDVTVAVDETQIYTGTAAQQCLRLNDGGAEEYRLPTGQAEPVYIAVKGTAACKLRLALTSPGRTR